MQQDASEGGRWRRRAARKHVSADVFAAGPPVSVPEATNASTTAC